MAFAEGNRVSLSYAIEVTPGTTPAVAFQKVPYKTTSIEAQFNTGTTQSVRDDRMIDDLKQLSGMTQGDIAVETAYGVHEDFTASAFGSDFTVFTLTATDISAANADNSFNSAGSGFNTTTVKPGAFIKVAGFVNTANNGIHLVVSVTTAKIVVSAASTLVTEAGGPSVTVTCRTLRTGTNKKFFSIQRGFEDIGKYAVSRGMIVSNMTMNVSSGAFVESSYSFMGRDTDWAGTSFSTGTELAIPAWQAMTGTANVGQVFEAGSDTAAAGVYFRSINLTINPNVRELPAIGSLYAVSHNVGSFNITAQCEAYFNDSTLLEKFASDTSTSLSYRFTDQSGDVYVVYLPYCKFSAAGTSGIGLNSDVLQSVTFTALVSPTLGFMAQISKL